MKISNIQYPISNKGFTLIELIIAVMIIILFSALSLANYRRLNGQKELEAASQAVTDTLELARKKASAGDQIDFTCTADGSGVAQSGFRVTFTLPSTYTLQGCCHTACADAHTLNTTTLPGSVVMTSAPADIQFAQDGSTGSSETVRLQNASIEECIDVTVESNGLMHAGSRISC